MYVSNFITHESLETREKAFGSDDEKYEALSLRLKEEALQAKGKFLAKISHQINGFDQGKVVLLKGHRKSVSCVCISEDGKFAFSGGRDSSVIKWDLDTLSKVCVMPGGKRGTKYAYHTVQYYPLQYPVTTGIWLLPAWITQL
ncbi:unnamed protein product [Heterobilharzia americana]|nr:unnamed protein product [Heterobilharzia americana]